MRASSLPLLASVSAGRVAPPARFSPTQAFGEPNFGGTSVDALFWAASLAATEKAHVERSIRHFPYQRFCREHVFGIEGEERLAPFTVPPALKRFRSEVLASVVRPFGRMKVRFDGFDFPSLFNPRNEGWYDVGLLGYGDPAERALALDFAGFFPVG